MYLVVVLFVSSCYVCFFKQMTAYEMRISDWSSDVCSSDLAAVHRRRPRPRRPAAVPDRRQPVPGGRPAGRGESGERAGERAGGRRKGETVRTPRPDAGDRRAGIYRRARRGAERASGGGADPGGTGNPADNPPLYNGPPD